MKIYNYDENSGEFLGEGVAEVDPLENKPVIPANATIKKPTKAKSGMVKIWKDEKWKDIEDFRGSIFNVKDKQEIILKDLGPLPEGFTRDKPRQWDQWDEKEKMWAGHNENKAKWDKLKYSRDRQENYPSIGDQLDLIYWDKINNTNLWLEKIKEVKEKFPKG